MPWQRQLKMLVTRLLLYETFQSMHQDPESMNTIHESMHNGQNQGGYVPGSMHAPGTNGMFGTPGAGTSGNVNPSFGGMM